MVLPRLYNTPYYCLEFLVRGSIRMEINRQAKSLLSSTSLSVQEIADRLGFQNQSHFGTFFRRYSELSPSAYRKSVTG